MEQGGGASDNESGLEFVFYEPGSQPSRRRANPRPRWERYAGQILSARPQDTLDEILRSLPLPRQPHEEIIQTAKRLAEDILEDKNRLTSRCKELLLANLCIVLQKLGCNSPEELDPVIKIISDSSSTRYVDALKRGAKIANEIIIEWAAQPGKQSDLSRIGLATSIVFQACLSLVHWAAISDSKKSAKAQILTRPLTAHTPPHPGTPHLIPCLIDVITAGTIPFVHICTPLGYPADFQETAIATTQVYRTRLLATPASAPVSQRTGDMDQGETGGEL